MLKTAMNCKLGCRQTQNLLATEAQPHNVYLLVVHWYDGLLICVCTSTVRSISTIWWSSTTQCVFAGSTLVWRATDLCLYIHCPFYQHHLMELALWYGSLQSDWSGILRRHLVKLVKITTSLCSSLCLFRVAWPKLSDDIVLCCRSVKFYTFMSAVSVEQDLLHQSIVVTIRLLYKVQVYEICIWALLLCMI